MESPQDCASPSRYVVYVTRGRYSLTDRKAFSTLCSSAASPRTAIQMYEWLRGKAKSALARSRMIGRAKTWSCNSMIRTSHGRHSSRS